MKFDYINPKNYGIVQTVLSKENQDLCWELVKQNSPREAKWEGNTLIDVPTDLKQWWFGVGYKSFEDRICGPMLNAYIQRWGLPGKIETTHRHNLKLSRLWCRASTRHDYHALHDHRSIMTFVLWLHNPVNSEKEKNDQWGFRGEAGEVILTYNDTCGKLRKHNVPLSPERDGTMMLFPSDINHMSLPIHSTDEYRICIAGDIAYDSYKVGSQDGLMVT